MSHPARLSSMVRTANPQPFNGSFDASSNASDLWAPTNAPAADAIPAGQATAAGKKKHVCGVCSKAFTTSGHLSRHARVHTGERNHKCPFPGCETRCSRQDNLQQHYRIHLSPGSRRTSTNNTRSLTQGVMAINGSNGGVRKRSTTTSTPATKAAPPAPDSPPSTPPPLEQAYIAPQLPSPELTTSHLWLTSQNTSFPLDGPMASEPQPIPQSSFARHQQQQPSYGDLSFTGSTSLSAFDFGPGHGTSQSLPLPSLTSSFGSLYQDEFSQPPPLAYAVRPSQQQMHPHQQHMQMQQHQHQHQSETPSPVPSTLSITSSHSSSANHYFDTRAAHGMRPLDTNSLVFAAELSPSARYQPPPSSTVYMSLNALDAAHQQAAAVWSTGGGAGRSLHGPNSRLMRA